MSASVPCDDQNSLGLIHNAYGSHHVYYRMPGEQQTTFMPFSGSGGKCTPYSRGSELALYTRLTLASCCRDKHYNALP